MPLQTSQPDSGKPECVDLMLVSFAGMPVATCCASPLWDLRKCGVNLKQLSDISCSKLFVYAPCLGVLCLQAGKIVDTRVLLPDVVLQRAMGDLPEKGPSRVDEDAVGGEFELVASALDPLDLAWSSIGPHWMTSVFNGGNVWLVHTAGMGPTQRQRLALPAATPAVWFRTLQKPGMQTQPATDGSDDDSDSDDDSSMDDDSRWVVVGCSRGIQQRGWLC